MHVSSERECTPPRALRYIPGITSLHTLRYPVIAGYPSLHTLTDSGLQEQGNTQVYTLYDILRRCTSSGFLQLYSLSLRVSVDSQRDMDILTFLGIHDSLYTSMNIPCYRHQIRHFLTLLHPALLSRTVDSYACSRENIMISHEHGISTLSGGKSSLSGYFSSSLSCVFPFE